MNTTAKIIAVLIVLGAIAGGAYMLRKGTPQNTDVTINESTTTPQTNTTTTASTTIAAATGSIDDAVKAFDTEASEEGNIAAGSDDDVSAATGDSAAITSFSDTYGEANF